MEVLNVQEELFKEKFKNTTESGHNFIYKENNGSMIYFCSSMKH